MRDDHDTFRELGASILAVAPDSVEGVAKFTSANPVPYPIVADADHTAFDAYDVGNRALSLGQRPALFVIDRDGIVRFDSVGTQQWQIPTNERVLEVLRELA